MTEKKYNNDFILEDLWNLDDTIARFVLPRLKAFREQSVGRPGSMSAEEWDEILAMMIEGWEHAITPWENRTDKAQEGLMLFAQYLNDLWW